MFAWREELDGAGLAVTDRHGGNSAGAFSTLNLGRNVGDDIDDVEANRAAVAADLGVDAVVFLHQVHGTDVHVVDAPWAGDPPAGDALVTTTRGLALAVLVADCVPVLVVDPHTGVAGVAHAGRRGLAAGVVPRLVEVMQEGGARSLTARVGPSICGRCYEVPLELREEVAAVAPEARAITRHGTPSLDVAAGVMAQLAPHCADVTWLDGCSFENPDLFSYRRDGTTGRFAGLAWLT